MYTNTHLKSSKVFGRVWLNIFVRALVSRNLVCENLALVYQNTAECFLILFVEQNWPIVVCQGAPPLKSFMEFCTLSSACLSLCMSYVKLVYHVIGKIFSSSSAAIPPRVCHNKIQLSRSSNPVIFITLDLVLHNIWRDGICLTFSSRFSQFQDVFMLDNLVKDMENCEFAFKGLSHKHLCRLAQQKKQVSDGMSWGKCRCIP
jgi:hypothetical protein